MEDVQELTRTCVRFTFAFAILLLAVSSLLAVPPAPTAKQPVSPEIGALRQEIVKHGCKVLSIEAPAKPLTWSEAGASARLAAIARVRTPESKQDDLMLVVVGGFQGPDLQPGEFHALDAAGQPLRWGRSWTDHKYDAVTRKGIWRQYQVLQLPAKGAAALRELAGELLEKSQPAERKIGPYGLNELRTPKNTGAELPSIELFDWKVDSVPAAYLELEAEPGAPRLKAGDKYLSLRFRSITGPALGELQAAAYDADGKRVWLGWSHMAGASDVTLAESYVGLQVTPLTAKAKKTSRAKSGVLVAAVSSVGPAAKAGIKPGDVITRFGTTNIGSVQDLWLALLAAQNGVPTPVAAMRAGKRLSPNVVPEENPLWQGMAKDSAAALLRLRQIVGLVRDTGLTMIRLTSDKPVPATFTPVNVEFLVTMEPVVKKTLKFAFKDIEMPAGLWK